MVETAEQLELTSKMVGGGPRQPITIDVPGDKSISHRALILSALSFSTVQIKNLLVSVDTLTTFKILTDLGVSIHKDENGDWFVDGVGLHGFNKPDDVLDMGNSGTTCRLMMGILAGQTFETTITGDDSLKKRPMDRIVDPLREMGADITYLEEDGKLPIRIKPSELKSFDDIYKSEIPSAQVKSALLLASLYTDEPIVIVEDTPTRSHTETMLRDFGVYVKQLGSNGMVMIPNTLNHKSGIIEVPADTSSASFFAVIPSMLKDAVIWLHDFQTTDLRGQVIFLLANLFDSRFTRDEDSFMFHPTKIKKSDRVISAGYSPFLIDEYPIIMALGATVNGELTMEGIDELRFKECDRMDVMQAGLRACGVKVSSGYGWMKIKGTGKVKGGVEIKTHGDHRIAMAFEILNLVAEKPITVDNQDCVKISFPNFYEELSKIRG